MMTTRTVPPDLVERFETIRDAISNRLQVVLMYGGLRREICPHSLGWKGDHLSCFAYQFGGGSRQPLPPGGQWRCLHLHSMSGLTTREGEWHTGPVDPQTSPCIDDYEAYVGYPIGMGSRAVAPAGSLDALIRQRIEEALDPLIRRIEDLEWEIESNRPGEG
jgi:hypothetical protein